jgi:non-reducing end alpha-L-arabinofuranosidase
MSGETRRVSTGLEGIVPRYHPNLEATVIAAAIELYDIVKPSNLGRRFARSTWVAASAAIAMVLGLAATGTAGPCDIYQAGGTPCVAAHSTTRALYSSYAGNLYQVRRKSDNTTKDIGVLAAGTEANSATQDAFCANTSCTISLIYDQTSNHNDLTKGPGGGFPVADLEANAVTAKIKLNGRTVYGVYSTGAFEPSAGVGYRNNSTKGMATGDQAESIYMVADGKHYNQWCCFDYGNAETNTKDDGAATMEALYFGKSTQWGKGSGTGPWVMGDLEDGVFAGQSFSAPSTNVSLNYDYVTGMLKGNSGNTWALKAGNAQTGNLSTMYSGARPTGYSPMKKQGAIVLGIGGDNSHTAEGTFFEGCIVTGVPTDAVDAAIQANIVAAGYGSATTAIDGRSPTESAPPSIRRSASGGTTSVEFSLTSPSSVRLRLVDLRGREIARPLDAVLAAGPHQASWQSQGETHGVYAIVMEVEGRTTWTDKVAAP